MDRAARTTRGSGGPGGQWLGRAWGVLGWALAVVATALLVQRLLWPDWRQGTCIRSPGGWAFQIAAVPPAVQFSVAYAEENAPQGPQGFEPPMSKPGWSVESSPYYYWPGPGAETDVRLLGFSYRYSRREGWEMNVWGWYFVREWYRAASAPHWFVSLVLLAPAGHWAMRRRRRRRLVGNRVARGECTVCAYDLRGCAAPDCPECGATRG